MTRLLIALTLVLVVLMIVPGTAWSMSSTLIKDFESGFQTGGDDPGASNGWYNYVLSGTVTTSGETTIVHGGAASQKVDASAGEGGVKAKFDAVPGSTYTVSVWAYEQAGGGGAYLQVRGDGNEDPDPGGAWAATGGPSWNLLTQTVTASADSITVFLDGYYSVCYFDDVTVTGNTMQFEGGFQANGIGNDWREFIWAGGSPTNSASTAIKHSGAYAQRVSTPEEGGVQRDFPVTPGRTYAVSAWVYLESGVAYGAVNGQWYEIGGAGGSWMEMSWLYNSGEASSVNIILEVYGGSAIYDDVTITEVAVEPPLPPSPYYKIYHQTSELTGGGNIYYCGGVFDGKLYTGQNSQCAQQWGDEQVAVPVQTYDTWDPGLQQWVPSLTTDFSARLNMTQPWMPVGLYGPYAWPRPVAKCSVPLGGYIYMAGGGTAFFRTAGWWTGTEQPEITMLNTPAGEILDCICTDGQYIYATTWSPNVPERINKIYKYSIDVAGTVSNVSGWPVTVPGTTAFSGISYYGGKIYAVDGGSPYGIYEIDAGTGAATKLADFVYPNYAGNDTQVVRYGNQMFITCAATECHKLYTYTLNGGVWSATSSFVIATDDAGLDKRDTYGVAVKGDGTSAKYAWVTAEGSTIFFLGLTDPWAGSPTDLRAVEFKNAHRAHVSGVITATGPGDTFWIENAARTTAALVYWNWLEAPVTIGNTVTVKGHAGRNAHGERTLTPIVGTGVTEGAAADPAVKPLIMSNRALGPATGSVGLRNDGMLVTVYGKVTHYEASLDCFYIDDGSGVQSDLPDVKGVKVQKADTLPMIYVPNWDRLVAGETCYATITGVVGLEKLADGTTIRRINARSDADIKIVVP